MGGSFAREPFGPERTPETTPSNPPSPTPPLTGPGVRTAPTPAPPTLAFGSRDLDDGRADVVAAGHGVDLLDPVAQHLLHRIEGGLVDQRPN